MSNLEPPSPGPRTEQYASRRDDAVAGICGLWMVTGLFVDGWAHRVQKPETFFTPWHGLLYSGFIASAVWLLFVVRRFQAANPAPARATPARRSIRDSFPVGYEYRSLGVAVFGVGAIGDLIWHTVFGIEANIEALLSPTHLILLTGGILMATGPIVSVLSRGEGHLGTWSATGALVSSVAFILMVLQFFTMYLSPYSANSFTSNDASAAWATSGWLGREVQTWGIASMMIFTLTTIVALTFLVDRIELPCGTFFLVLVAPAFAQTVLWSLRTTGRLLGPILAATIGELFWRRVKSRSLLTRGIFLGALMTTMWFGLLAAVGLRHGLGWTVHIWTGVPFMCGLLSTLTYVATSRAQPRT